MNPLTPSVGCFKYLRMLNALRQLHLPKAAQAFQQLSHVLACAVKGISKFSETYNNVMKGLR